MHNGRDNWYIYTGDDEVMRLWHKGKDTKDISADLMISEATASMLVRVGREKERHEREWANA